jgi:hypothetical protein
MAPWHTSSSYKENRLSCLMITCHNGEATIPPNLHTKFKPCRRYGLVSQIDLSICHEDYLAYLVMEALVKASMYGYTRASQGEAMAGCKVPSVSFISSLVSSAW